MIGARRLPVDKLFASVYHVENTVAKHTTKQETMTNPDFSPRALFISADGTLYSDSLICSGLLPARLGGRPCPFSQDRQMPRPQPLDSRDAEHDPGRGKPGDLCPACAVAQIGALDDWEEHERLHLPAEVLPLRLFQCRQGFWLVVPGLYNDDPTRIVLKGQPD